jgi:hypothetical protein
VENFGNVDEAGDVNAQQNPGPWGGYWGCLKTVPRQMKVTSVSTFGTIVGSGTPEINVRALILDELGNVVPNGAGSEVNIVWHAHHQWFTSNITGDAILDLGVQVYVGIMLSPSVNGDTVVLYRPAHNHGADLSFGYGDYTPTPTSVTSWSVEEADQDPALYYTYTDMPMGSVGSVRWTKQGKIGGLAVASVGKVGGLARA